MTTLGIYVGTNGVSLVEAKGSKVASTIQISQERIMGANVSEADAKIPSEIRLIALLNDEFRKSRIIAKNAALVLPGKELIIRTFEMPRMSSKELNSTVAFEARKYIPFKIEELVFDFQVYPDRVSRNNLILLVGIKKETLDKYRMMFSQLKLDLVSLEYAGFSVLRLFKMARAQDRGVVGVLAADFVESDEAKCMVLENGFPLFTRDIMLAGEAEESPDQKKSADSAVLLEKLKSELRISLDYYHRKFPTKNFTRLQVTCDKNFFHDIEMLVRDFGLSAQLVDVEQGMGRAMPFSLGVVKGYGVSQYKTTRIFPNANLLTQKAKPKKQEFALPTQPASSVFEGVSLNPAMLVLVAAICLTPVGIVISKRIPLERKLLDIRSQRPAVKSLTGEETFQEITAVSQDIVLKLSALEKLFNEKEFLTEPLNVIPEAIVSGVWLEDFSFTKQFGQDEAVLDLKGVAYAADSEKEFQMLNTFYMNLKNNAVFANHFNDISLASLERRPLEESSATYFVITCRNKKGNQ
ncbi:MAG: pilus assembly protein PilM [Candidatus Omnitrophica bacterium]|nr:pilus assembly protein PilM [Candidatus Omnitrophota bacterium]